ncbi:MAG: PIN domain-containing protein [Chloroflexi bacterium]|nr:PIN domain-containing protein [Chloroflexota bacterium]
MQAERFLIDTSVWLDVLPPGRGSDSLRRRVDALLAADVVATIGMVRLELLGGTRSQKEWLRLGQLLSALHQLEIPEAQWDEAARLGFQLRRQGVVVPFTDLLITSVAILNGAVLVHRDRHFDLMAPHLRLRVESYVIE